jgi:hypothetical protein
MIGKPFAEWLMEYHGDDMIKIGLLRIEIAFNQDSIKKRTAELIEVYLKEGT